ncbi:MAG: BACON domain-containing protein [Verrucomicrobiota bacterium]|nr:BACON domain-containing protein [Verrucomicrobiota bacterium]
MSSKLLLGLSFILYAGIAHAQFSINPTEITFPKEGGTGTAYVSSQGFWPLNIDVEWVTASKSSGFGNESFDYTVAANSGPERTAVINAASAYLTITQEGTAPVPVSIFLTAGETVDYEGGFVFNFKLGFLYDGYYPFVFVYSSGEWVYVFENGTAGESGWYLYDFTREQFGFTGAAFYPWYFPLKGILDDPAVDFSKPSGA